MANSLNFSFSPSSHQNETVLVAQVSALNCPSDANNPSVSWTMTSGQALPEGYNPLNDLTACETSNTYYGADHKGQSWVNHFCGRGGGYSHIMTPNLKACYFSGNSLGGAQPDFTLVGASTYHPGRVNTVFVDGSARFIKNSVSPPTWWALATKAGGEVISSDSD